MDDCIFLNFITLLISLHTIESPKSTTKMTDWGFFCDYIWMKKKPNLNKLELVFSWSADISLFQYLAFFIKISLTMLFRLHLTARLSHIHYPLWAQEWNEPFNWALITWLLHSLLMICTLKGESKYCKRNSNGIVFYETVQTSLPRMYIKWAWMFDASYTAYYFL